MTNIIDQSFDIIIPIFKFFGLLPTKNRPKILILTLFLSKVLLTVGVFVNLIARKSSDFTAMTQLAMFLPSVLSSCFRDVPFLTDGHRMQKCINFFGRADFVPKSNQEKKIVDNSVQTCRRHVRIYLISIVAGETCWNLFPLFEKKHKLSLDIWLPYDTTEPGVFYLTYFYVCAGMMNFFLIYVFFLMSMF